MAQILVVCLSSQEARLFGPAIFEAAKLRVLFLGADKEHPDNLPRIYTLTHSDVTSKITLAISREINKAQVCSSCAYSGDIPMANRCTSRDGVGVVKASLVVESQDFT